MSNSSILFVDQPCIRCGSRKNVTQKWRETIEILIGTSTIEHSQIVCANNVCQAEFEKNLAEETKKREEARAIKEANKAVRKAELVLQVKGPKI